MGPCWRGAIRFADSRRRAHSILGLKPQANDCHPLRGLGRLADGCLLSMEQEVGEWHRCIYRRMGGRNGELHCPYSGICFISCPVLVVGSMSDGPFLSGRNAQPPCLSFPSSAWECRLASSACGFRRFDLWHSRGLSERSSGEDIPKQSLGMSLIRVFFPALVVGFMPDVPFVSGRDARLPFLHHVFWHVARARGGHHVGRVFIVGQKCPTPFSLVPKFCLGLQACKLRLRVSSV